LLATLGAVAGTVVRVTSRFSDLSPTHTVTGKVSYSRKAVVHKEEVLKIVAVCRSGTPFHAAEVHTRVRTIHIMVIPSMHVTRFMARNCLPFEGFGDRQFY